MLQQQQQKQQQQQQQNQNQKRTRRKSQGFVTSGHYQRSVSSKKNIMIRFEKNISVSHS